MSLPWLDTDLIEFPPIESALEEPNGLLAAGGDLRPERLIEAYRNGIFPWYEVGQPILWWSPDPRMVIFPEHLQVSTSLRKFIRKQTHNITMDTRFSEVIDACSGKRRSSEGTWITPELKHSLCRLHDMGVAHSLEVWQEQELIGGLYGIAMGKLFFGESMFSWRDNASKLALVFLVLQLRQWDFYLIDCQVSSAHLESLGAEEISRLEFKQALATYLDKPGKTGKWDPTLTKQQLIDEL